MKTSVLSKLFQFTALAISSVLVSGDFPLAQDGRTRVSIVLPKDAPQPVVFGASELATYTAKITGCAKPPIVNSASENTPASGALRLAIGTVKDQALLAEASIKPSDLKEDGFAIVASADRLLIIGGNPRGALYGCYEILKAYGGVKWLVPGEDGEYISPKKDILVPEQRTIANPRFAYRLIQCYDDDNGMLWLVRNNLFGLVHPNKIWLKDGKRTKKADFYEGLAMNIDPTAGNSHILGNLLWGWGNGQEQEAAKNKLFAEHPEYFPLLNGKRDKDAYANPCISSPGLLDHMAKHLYEYAKGSYQPRGYITIGNNDTTLWCQCDECKKLDTPELIGTKGARSDRYWYMVNGLARRIWAIDPNIKLGGWAYQDFWYPPVKVKVDPRLRLIISFNNQCWKHTVLDTKCPINQEFCKIVRAWQKTGHPFTVNREEIYCETVGDCFLPAEEILFTDIDRQYESLGFAGNYFCVHSPFPAFKAHNKNHPPYFGKNYPWHAMWQTCYISARAMWSKNQDFAKIYEDINALYYGKAWDGGYREFKKLQTQCFLETPACFGWNLYAPLGACLNKTGSEQKLKSLMADAVAAAEADGDQRALAHIKTAQEIFQLTWLKAREQYALGHKELNVYKRTAPIVIDGIIDEPDWRNADPLDRFIPVGHTPKDAAIQPTAVRICYDRDTLYIAVEAMEPTPDKLLAGDRIARDGTSNWNDLGNHLELFYSYPDMADKYYHLAINSKGQIWDAIQNSIASRDNSFVTKADFAVKVLKDRWTLEIAIPASDIGMNLLDGATWKFNAGRSRVLEGQTAPEQRETSTCGNKSFHGVLNFINIKFVPTRPSGFRQNRVHASWNNASFDITQKDDDIRGKFYRWSNAKGWTFAEPEHLTAKDWYVNPGTTGTYMLHDGSDSNRFIRLNGGGYIAQYFVSDAPGKIRISFRARGKGVLTLWTSIFQPNENGSGFKSIPKTTRTFNAELTPEWKTYSFEREKAGIPKEHIPIRFFPAKNSTADIDDCCIIPLE